METVTTYLESGSINGLNHIAATKKWAQLFWILVVNGGFIISTFLIVEMYISWGDNPIRTNIDTLPVSEFKFPKVTVCPPRGTFTDLNYDIKRAEGKNMTLKEREELNNYARDTVERISFMENLNQLQEKDRFYNWYHAITGLHGKRRDFLSKKYLTYHQEYIVETTATSGVITSHLFGKKFDKNLIFEKIKTIEIRVFPSSSITFSNETNVTLHFHLEKISVPGLKGLSGRSHTFEFGVKQFEVWAVVDKVPDDQNTAHFSITNDYHDGYYFKENIELNKVDISELEMDQMPGFNFSWWYTGGDMEPGNIYKEKCKDDWNCQDPDDYIYKEFVRDGVFLAPIGAQVVIIFVRFKKSFVCCSFSTIRF